MGDGGEAVPWSARSGPTSSGCSARLLNRLKWCSGGDR
jgi:hypothetical protein